MLFIVSTTCIPVNVNYTSHFQFFIQPHQEMCKWNNPIKNISSASLEKCTLVIISTHSSTIISGYQRT